MGHDRTLPTASGAGRDAPAPRVSVADLRSAKWQAIMFADGEKGMAMQIYRCVEFPSLTMQWRREHARDKGTQTLFVGSLEVPDIEAAAEMLSAEQSDG